MSRTKKPRAEFITVDDNGKLRLNLHPGQTRTWDSRARFVFMLAGTQGGKALALDTPIPTPTGFKPMGDLAVGDLVFDENGQPCTVTYATDVMHGHTCYEVVFDDGATIIADADHLWLTQTHNQRKNEARRVKQPDPSWTARPQCQAGEDASIRTTQQIADSLHHFISGKARANHSIPIALPVEYRTADLPIPPYTFGAWLGDGYSDAPSLVVADDEIVANVRAEGVPIEPVPWDCNTGKATVYRLGTANGKGSRNPFTQLLNRLNVRNNKHIPDLYLTAAVAQRLALLQGLMDTDGYAKETGRAEFTTTSAPLATGVMQLLRSLGIKGRMTEERATLAGVDCGAKYRITFSTKLPAFRLRRKLERQHNVMGRDDISRRFVHDVRPVPSVPVRCIQVDSPSHLYLAGHDYIVTHNTSFGPWWLHREIYDPVIGRGGGDYLAVTSTFDLFKLKMLPEMRRVFEDYLGVARFWPGDKILELKDPDSGEFWAKRSSDVMWGRIILRSASAEGGLESTTARAAWLDEVGQEKFSLEAWEAILRRLSLEQGRVLGTTTLYTTGWLKQQVYDEWVRGDPEYECIQFASYINPLFNRKEYETRKSKMPEWKFRMFYRGEFTRPPGLIYGDYDETRHKIPRFPIPSHWPRYVGLDPGGVNLATMWLAHDQVHNRFFAYRSTLEGEMTTREHVEKAKERGAGENVRLWAGAAPSEDQVRKDWGDHGITIMKPTVADVESGIDRVAELFKTNRLYVFDDLTGLRDELGSYSRELDKNLEPTEKIKDKNLYHRCFVAGTLIATSRGDVPIEHVQIGDLVLTRQGFQPVVDACMTDPAADVHTLVASDGRSLTGTGNHPIFTQNRGLVSLDSLRYSDIITLCEHVGSRYNISGETGWHGRNQEPIEMLSSIGGASLCVTLIAAIAQIVSTIVQWIMMVKNTCIGTSMNARSVQSRLAPLSIIKTEIHSTTIRRITSWLNPILSTWRSTLPKYQTIDSPNFANLRKLGEHLRLSGTNPKLAANGTANMESGHGKTDLPLLTFVSSAINRSKRLPVMETPGFVATSIRPLLGSPVELTTKNAHAHAETPLPVTNTVNSACAAAHVLDVIAEIEPKPVYNLTIADAHEYFANGILVHNCDALRYIATWLPTADASDIDVSAQESMNPWEFIQPASAMTPGVPFAVRNAPTATPAADAVRW